MTLRACTHQKEVLQLLKQGHWPHACPAELRKHLSGCRSCAELVLVTQAFQQSRAATAAQVKLRKIRARSLAALWTEIMVGYCLLEKCPRPLCAAESNSADKSFIVMPVGAISGKRVSGGVAVQNAEDVPG